MIKKFILWPSDYGLPAWWLFAVIMNLMVAIDDHTEDALPLVAGLLLLMLVFLVALLAFSLFTKWLTILFKAEPFGHKSDARTTAD